MSASAPPLPDPYRRNFIWICYQCLFRVLFTVAFRYRTLHVERVPKTGGGLMLVNHQSFLDPLLAGLPLPRPVSFIARENLFNIPVIGLFVRTCYVIPINRQSAGSGSFREAIRRMKANFLVGVFPEGTRSADGKLAEIKGGFIALARRGKQPIYPVAIAGAHRVMPRGGLRFFFRKIRIVYGKPIPVEEVQRLAQKGNEELFLAVIRERMQECLDEANDWCER